MGDVDGALGSVGKASAVTISAAMELVDGIIIVTRERMSADGFKSTG